MQAASIGTILVLAVGDQKQQEAVQECALPDCHRWLGCAAEQVTIEAKLTAPDLAS